MWISKLVYKTLILSWEEQIEQFKAKLKATESDVLTLDTRTERLQAENRGLRERLVTAEGAAQSARAMRDLLVVQNGQLQEERGQFLQKVLDPDFKPQIRVPKILSAPTIVGPGLDFEDMGDTLAQQMGHTDHIPVADSEHVLEREDDITGLVGQVYDPASELGNELPRLGDNAMQPPDM